jgi:hypothetical protein
MITNTQQLMMDNLCYLTKRLAVLKSTPPLLQRVSGPRHPGTRISLQDRLCRGLVRYQPRAKWRHVVYARSQRGPPVPSTVAAMARGHRRARPNATSTPDTRAALLPYVRPLRRSRARPLRGLDVRLPATSRRTHAPSARPRTRALARSWMGSQAAGTIPCGSSTNFCATPESKAA